jgi:hypothetical protein
MRKLSLASLACVLFILLNLFNGNCSFNYDISSEFYSSSNKELFNRIFQNLLRSSIDSSLFQTNGEIMSITSIQDTCESNLRAKPNTYELKVNCKNHNFYNCSDLIPREVTVDELCLIESLRQDSQMIIHQLDNLHEVYVFPRNQIKLE